MPQMMCVICDATRGTEDKFCWKCGAELKVYEKKCTCGHTLDKIDAFCSQCGKRKGE